MRFASGVRPREMRMLIAPAGRNDDYYTTFPCVRKEE
jgi:hypothetical protein